MRLTKDTKSYIEELFYDEPDNIEVRVSSKYNYIIVDVEHFINKHQIDKMAQLGLEFRDAQITNRWRMRCVFTKIKKHVRDYGSRSAPVKESVRPAPKGKIKVTTGKQRPHNQFPSVRTP